MAEIGFEIETEFQNTLAYFKILVSVAQMGSNHEKIEVNNLVTHSLIKNVYKNKKEHQKQPRYLPCIFCSGLPRTGLQWEPVQISSTLTGLQTALQHILT